METAMFDVGDYVKINAETNEGIEGVDDSVYRIDAIISINGRVYYRLLTDINSIYGGAKFITVPSTDVYSYEEKPKESDDTDKVIPLYPEKAKESDDTDKVIPLYTEKAKESDDIGKEIQRMQRTLNRAHRTLTDQVNGYKCEKKPKNQSCDIKLANKTEKDIAEACNQLMVTLIKKNRDYGDSFGNTFRELGPITGLTRFLDKVNRIKNLTKEAGKHEVADESLLDTWKDAAGYAILNYINLLPSKEVTDKNSQITKDNK